MPLANINDNISAPRAGPKPRSVQYATMCTWGMDIATQQATPATLSKPNARLRGRPNGVSLAQEVREICAPAGVGKVLGGRVRNAHDNNNMPPPQTRPNI